MKKYDLSQSRLHLFPTPTFWTGIGSLIDVCGLLNMANYAETDEQADADALRSDWLAVGDDIAAAIGQYRESLVRTNE
ncbi:MAG: hypothetical protein OXE52_03280 [Chloroflexi bacterium]|nr:hypothetical protein [Chloroflexota bacterium]